MKDGDEIASKIAEIMTKSYIDSQRGYDISLIGRISEIATQVYLTSYASSLSKIANLQNDDYSKSYIKKNGKRTK